MEQSLYTFAVIKQGLWDRDGKETDPAAVLVEPTTVLASSLEQATVFANRAIPEDELPNIDRITVLVKAF